VDELRNTLERIGSPDAGAMEACRRRLDSLTKPPGSLGMLEDIAIRVAGITGEIGPSLRNKVVLVMAGDHGVAARGVSAYPREVTGQMVLNFMRGGAAVNVLARQVGARVVVTDVGVAADLAADRRGTVPGVAGAALRVDKCGKGTRDMTQGPAMTREEAIACIEAGIRTCLAEIGRGADIVATGDMGIGNTTASAAMLSALGGFQPAEVTGRGTGVDDEGLRRKVAVIERALGANRPDPSDPLDVLSKVGGFEIGAIAGAILAAATQRVPVIVDGFISAVGAVLAESLRPGVSEFAIASHLSEEPGHAAALRMIGLEPALRMRMRLGEGTGAVLAMWLVEAACRIVREMSTFADAGVSRAGGWTR
jgi:nicotinate-nucleotide--dimethylbenzimidazole phosphoribosyltransferase